MKFTTLWLALLATVLPATTSAFVVPNCGATNCLQNGVFYACPPSNLTCLCSKDQVFVDQYVQTVKPCLESEKRRQFCTDGALYEYKDLLVQVCKKQGNAVAW